MFVDAIMTIMPTVTYFICEERGFMPKLSAVTNLSVYSQFVSVAFEHGKQFHIIFTDFTSRRLIRYRTLLSKLFSVGFRDPFLSWICSYRRSRLFADDFKIFKEITNVLGCFELQLDLYSMVLRK